MRRGSGQDGFTLIEMLAAMAAGLVVFGATLSLLTAADHNVLGSTQRNEAQNLARLGIDLIARQLRNISSPISSPKEIERATPYDIVFQTVGTPSGANVSGAQRVRYCIPADTSTGTPANERLISQTQTWMTDPTTPPPPSPWPADPSTTIPCPDSSTPTSRVVANAVTNRYQQRTDRPAFTYNNGTAPTDLSQIISVQTDLFVNPTPRVTAAEAELKSGAYLRNQLRAPVASFTPISSGNGGVVLNGGTSYSPSGYDLSYSWLCISSLCPSATTLAGATDGLVSWHPGAGTYTVSLTVTDPSGLTATSTQQVTVP